jgi:hypothetical protein
VTDRDRPTPRPRPGGAPTARPSPRPRVAGSRRDRDEAARPAPSARQQVAERDEDPAEPQPRIRARRERPVAVEQPEAPAARRSWLLPVSLLLLVALAAGAVAVLLRQRADPPYVDSSVFAATQDNVEALYAYDYRDSEGSVAGKLDALTGDLREQYESDLSQGGILETYEQVSATTRYEVLDIGLQQINDAQDTATLVVFGSYVVESVTSGDQPAPEGSECTVTPEGAQSCVQTVQVRMQQVEGDWKISELTLLTTS